MLCFALMMNVGCAVKIHLPQCERDGKKYCTLNGAFRNRWHNYFEIGRSCMEGGCYDDALTFFQKAIDRREEDKRMARKYGLHRIDYFPHRESGIIYFLIGNDSLSEDQLKISISQEPSAKAYHYLDEVRKRQLEKKRIAEGPLLSFEETTLLTNADPIWISGTASDASYVKSITVENKDIYQEYSQERVPFQKPLHLEEGTHVIHICATNLTNQATKEKLTIQIDRSGPVISFFQKKEMILGELSDICNTMRLFANDTEIPIKKGNRVPFQMNTHGMSRFIELVAEDSLGNTTSAIIPLTKETKTVYFKKQLTAGIGNMMNGLTNDSPFSVVIDNWIDNQTIYDDKISITGTIFSEDQIAGVSIGNIAFPNSNGKTYIFNRTVPLHLGDNQILMSVKDVLGRKYRRTLHINRKQSKAWNVDQRIRIHHCVFDNSQQPDFMNIFNNSFWNEMIRRKRFQIKPTPSFGIETNVMGNFFVEGVIDYTREGIEITSSIFKGDSTFIECIDVYTEHQLSELTTTTANRLAMELVEKFHQHFPMMDGIITDIKDNQIWMVPQKGCLKPEKVAIGWPMVSYQQMIWKDDIINGCTRVYGKQNHAIQIFFQPNVRFRIGDRIITQ